jgi:hypothetical protein
MFIDTLKNYFLKNKFYFMILDHFNVLILKIKILK